MSTTEPAGQAHYAHKECGGITVWDLSGGFCVKCHAEGLDMEDVERREAAPSATKPCGCGPDEPCEPHAEADPGDGTSQDQPARHEDAQAQDGASPGEPHMDLLEAAWGVIANAGWDDCAKTTGWQEAAERWRDDYHRWLDLHLRPGGYQTWEELAGSLVRERDALFAEVAGLRRDLQDAAGAEPIGSEGEAAIVLCPRCLHDGALERTLARAEAAEARLTEVRETVGTFLAVRGGGQGAQDLAEAVRQVLSRDEISSEEGN